MTTKDRSDKVYGVDLGTTNSAIAHLDEFGRPTIINNTEGMPTTPSAVLYENEEIVVGQQAKYAPEKTAKALLFKRSMGSTEPRDLDGQEFTPEELSAFVLQKLVKDANGLTRSHARKVVISVPAYFGQLEKNATRQAGEIADLEVIGIVAEPVAAALGYFADRNVATTALVYDLGGGTFDVTVLRAYGDTRPLEVLVTDGNQELGGADWDLRLKQLLAEKIQQQLTTNAISVEDVFADGDFWEDTAIECERVKSVLSQRLEASVRLMCQGKRFTVSVTRAEFEDSTSDLLAATMDTTIRVLDNLRQLHGNMGIDEVLLVGGSTRMPAVETALRLQFPETKIWSTDQDLVVAKGAAVYASALEVDVATQRAMRDTDDASDIVTQKDERPLYLASTQRVVRNVLSRGLGLLVVDDRDEEYISFIAAQNEQLPIVEREIYLQVAQDDTTAVRFELFEQRTPNESPDREDNSEITPENAEFAGLPGLPKGSPIHALLSIDNEGKVEITAREPASDKELSLTVDISVMQADDVARLKARVARLQIRD